MSKVVVADAPRDFAGLKAYLAALNIEGLVWWYEGKPIAKIKKRDFGLARCAPEWVYLEDAAS